MSTLTIKDLPDSNELDRDAMAKVRGGWLGLAWTGGAAPSSGGSTTSSAPSLHCANGMHFPQ